MNNRFPFSALSILLGIVFVSVGLAFLFSPVVTMFPEYLPEDLKGKVWVTLYGGGSIPQVPGQFQTDEFSLDWLPGWTRVEVVNTNDKSVTWNWNLGSNTMYSYTLPQESCKKLGGMSLFLTFTHEEGSVWDYYDVSECRDLNPPKKVEHVVEGDPILVTIQILGQSCPEGEVVGMNYGYRQVDETQPMTYSILGETETHEIDMNSQETMINFSGYTEEGEPFGRYADDVRVLHNATCMP
jgi:hypothetical protein